MDNQEQKPVEEKEPEVIGLKVPLDKFTMGLLPGGMFFLSIPVHKTPRPFALGVAWDALQQLTQLYDNMDFMREKHKPKSLTEGVKEFASGLFKP